MTVQSEVSRSGPYAGAGTTGPFTVGFRFLADSHLRVIQTSAAGVDTDLGLTNDYSVTGAGNDTGTVTLVVALPIGASLTIIRAVPFTQEADYVDNDAFPAESHETALDKLTMQTQQIKEAQDRALALPATASGGVSTELPNPAANNIIGWNSSADGLQNINPASLAGIISYGTFIVDVFNGDGSETDFMLTQDALVSANCDVVVGGVYQTPDISYEYIPSSKTIRFKTGAPPVGMDSIVVRYGSVLDVGYASAIDGQTAIGTSLIKAASTAAARSVIGAVGLDGGDVFTVSPMMPDIAATDYTGRATNSKFVQDSISLRGVDRNRLRNGDFRVNQTGMTFTSTSLRPNNDDAYTLDGWFVLSDGNDIIDVSQESSVVPTNGLNAISLDVETINKKFGIAQIIEAKDCVGLIGNAVTLSFKAKVSSAAKLDNIKCAIVAWSGAADLVTSDIISSWNLEGVNPTLIANATYENVPANLNLTTSYSDYSVTATVDTASAKNLIVFIWSDVTDTTLNEFLYITDVQLERGPFVSAYDRKPYIIELSHAQRFLPVWNSTGVLSLIGSSHTSSATTVRGTYAFKQTARIAPTGLLSTAASQFSNFNSSALVGTAISFDISSQDIGCVSLTVSGSSPNLGSYWYATNASAQLIFTGAEL